MPLCRGFKADVDCDDIIVLYTIKKLLKTCVCVCVCRCWLRVDNYFIWSFIGPVSFIIMVLFSPLCPFSALLTDFVFPLKKKKNAVLVLSNKALLFTYGSVAADGFVFGSNMLYMSGALRFGLDTGTCSHFRNCDFFF